MAYNYADWHSDWQSSWNDWHYGGSDEASGSGADTSDASDGSDNTGNSDGYGSNGPDTSLTSLLAVPEVTDLARAVSAVVNVSDSPSDGHGGEDPGDGYGGYGRWSDHRDSADNEDDSYAGGYHDGWYSGDHSNGSDGDLGPDVYAALLLPSNNSGARGAVAVGFDEREGDVTIAVEAHGLTPNQIHPQHIHGFEDDRPSQLPTIAYDTDRDGFIESPEGERAIGPVILSATASGEVTSAELIPDFPRADQNGNLSFLQTYHFDLADKQEASIFEELQDRVAGRAFEIHGLTIPAGEGAGTPGEVNGTGGYIQGLPTTGGILTQLDEHALDGLSHDGVLMA